MIQAIFVFTIIAVLCLAHIHLCFLSTDMKIQHVELQKQHRMLLQEQDKIERQNEALCDRQRLAMLAQSERMQSIDVTRQVVAMVPRELHEKYAAPIKSDSLPRMDTLVASASEAGDFASKLLRLVDVASAQASSVPER